MDVCSKIEAIQFQVEYQLLNMESMKEFSASRCLDDILMMRPEVKVARWALLLQSPLTAGAKWGMWDTLISCIS